MQHTTAIEIVTIPSMRALAVRTPTREDKGGTREAWRKLTEAVPLDDPRWADPGIGYVFIPQRQWEEQVETLWVGMAVRDFGAIPDGLEAIAVPGSLCAKRNVYGDEAHMNEAYGAMFDWLKTNGQYELDVREGVLGLEANRLAPVNPFTIPYEAVGTFDFDMLYPIRKRTE